MPFKNRKEAGLLLAKKLRAYQNSNPLVLGIPRGAVPMASIISEKLKGELDVVLVHKIGAPGNPEFAIGSVAEDGTVYLNEITAKMPGVEKFVREQAPIEAEKLRNRRKQYAPYRKPADPKDRVVIIVDNGMATGATMIAALRLIRMKKPSRLIAAAAVSPLETVNRISREADETIILKVPKDFFAVGQFFGDFTQVTDEEVAACFPERAAPTRK
ncbi:MAG TPA: phosphoribosyltransferase family protein [Nitrospiria bacterium]